VVHLSTQVQAQQSEMTRCRSGSFGS
jgi:hypothetical protein